MVKRVRLKRSKKYIKQKEKRTNHNFCGTQTVIKGKFIALNAYIIKKDLINQLSFHLKKIGK